MHSWFSAILGAIRDYDKTYLMGVVKSAFEDRVETLQLKSYNKGEEFHEIINTRSDFKNIIEIIEAFEAI